MRQPSIIILLTSLLFLIHSSCSYGAVKGGIEYNIPTDYSKLSEAELNTKAGKYYFLAQKLKDGVVNEDMTNALTLYSVLQNINPENIDYAVKAGALYDKIGMDRYAKGNFSRAIGIDSSKPEPYFYFGEFYYKRQMYRKAIKYYNEAYKRGMVSNYNLLYKMGDIYEKFGDTRSALKYLNEASKQSPNSELDNKIKRIELSDSVNKEYYSNTRLRG